VKKDKKERYIAASKNTLSLEKAVKSALDSLFDTPSRASVMSLEATVDSCITARSHIISIFSDAQVMHHLFYGLSVLGLNLSCAGCFRQHE
jgi:hypothetical protein